MTSREALLKLCFKYLPTIDEMYLNLDKEDEELLNIIQNDLEILELLKSKLKLKSFTLGIEDIVIYEEDEEVFNKVKEWLENE